MICVRLVLCPYTEWFLRPQAQRLLLAAASAPTRITTASPLSLSTYIHNRIYIRCIARTISRRHAEVCIMYYDPQCCGLRSYTDCVAGVSHSKPSCHMLFALAYDLSILPRCCRSQLIAQTVLWADRRRAVEDQTYAEWWKARTAFDRSMG